MQVNKVALIKEKDYLKSEFPDQKGGLNRLIAYVAKSSDVEEISKENADKLLHYSIEHGLYAGKKYNLNNSSELKSIKYIQSFYRKMWKLYHPQE